MSRYFFDIKDGIELRDEIGRELRPGVILRAEALQVVTTLMEAEAADAKDTTLALTVRDHAGTIPLKIRLVCQVEEPQMQRPSLIQSSTSPTKFEV